MNCIARIGERIDDPDAPHIMENTGIAWAPVCPTDDIAMVTRDAGGWLTCERCGVRACDVNRLGAAGAA